ncbi:polyprenyl synthetase family protein [Opitutales bacterium]|nr:polyprenyl synthetase family protein [Opitutales bacterium]
MDCSLNFLSRLEWRLRNYFCEDPILKDYADDPYFWSGQKIRAKICLSVGKSFGIEEDLLLEIAAFTDILHNASLIHDDLIDNDEQRRGCVTPWKKYGREKALLLGDLLIAKSLAFSANINTEQPVKAAWASEISNCVISAVRGAFHELDFNPKSSDDLISQYMTMSCRKTGVMFALPARCVAIAAGKNQEFLDSITEIFTNMAISYQIRDDQSDYLGIKKGRDNLSDLKNNRPNLYYLLEQSTFYEGAPHEFIEGFQKDLIAKAFDLAKLHLPEMSEFFSSVIIPFITLDKKVPATQKFISIS